MSDPWTAPATWRAFWLRRFFRIAPAYYLLLIVALLIGPWLGECRTLIAGPFPGTTTPIERYTDASFANIAAHVSFVFGALPAYAFRTPLPDWSIGLEMQFYAVFPFLMLLIGVRGRAVRLALAEPRTDQQRDDQQQVVGRCDPEEAAQPEGAPGGRRRPGFAIAAMQVVVGHQEARDHHEQVHRHVAPGQHRQDAHPGQQRHVRQVDPERRERAQAVQGSDMVVGTAARCCAHYRSSAKADEVSNARSRSRYRMVPG